jgi:ADP-ribose pyrophosphatase
MSTRELARTPYLRLLERDGWYFVQRCNNAGVVGIVALTADRCLLLVEQFRPVVGSRVIELPAGLAGDHAHTSGEDFAEAARRELLEETGYSCARMERLFEGVSSAGVTDERVVLYRAHELTRSQAGGGIDDERIVLHQIPLNQVHAWLMSKQSEGVSLDFRIYAALYLLAREEASFAG